MNSIIYTLILILMFTLQAQAQLCPKVSTNKEFIRITKKVADIKTHTDVNVSTFNDTTNLHNTKLVMGFTLGKISLSTNFTIKYQKANDKFCAWLESANVHYKLEPLDVYIPNDFETGTCKYTEVSNHELEHVKIFKDTYEEYYVKLKKLLLKKNTLTKPSDAILVRSISEAEEIFKDDLNRILNKFQSELIKVLNKRQKAIDTEENYKTIASRCEGWHNFDQ